MTSRLSVQAFRRMLHRPGFAAVVVLVVALSLGLAVAAMSLAYEVFMRPLPFHASDRLAIYCCPFPKQGEGWRDAPGSPAAMRDYQRMAQSAEDVAIYYDYHSLNLTNNTTDTGAERLPVTFVSGNYFPLLGISPVMGRYFTPPECGEGTAYPLVVASFAFWKNHLGGRSDVIGTTVNLSGIPYTLIGIMPETFRDLSTEVAPPQLWLPMPAATPYLGMNFLSNYALQTFRAAVRLKPNVSFTTAQREADVIARRIEEAQPITHYGRAIRLMPVREFFFSNTRRPILLLFGGALLVVALGAVNLANIFAVDALKRAHELALRAALGAENQQLARAVLVEALSPLLFGGFAGFGLAAILVQIFARVSALAFPDFARVQLSGEVLGAGFILLGFVVSVAALAPVLRVRTLDLRALLQSGSKGTGGTGATRTRHLLISLEVALASALLIGTGLTARSLFEMMRLNMGYNPDRLLSFQLQLDRNRLPTREQRITFARQLNDTLQGGPGIESAILWGPSMLSQAGWTFDVAPAGRDLNDPSSSLNVQHLDTIPGGLARLGIPLLRGRDFSSGAVPAYPLEAIIDEEAARRLWPGLDPIGRTMYLFHDAARPMTVIGLVPHVLNRGRAFDDARLLTGDVYVSFYQLGQERITVLIRHREGQRDDGVIAWVRAQLTRLDANLAPFNIATMDERFGREAQGPRFTAAIFGIYASISLLLTLVGIYGVISFSIAQRTREFGVRFAVGASRAQVTALVLRQTMIWICVGLIVGLMLGLIGAPLLDGLLIGVKPQDGSVFAATAAIMLLSGLVATLVPAIRAARVDPVVALRAE